MLTEKDYLVDELIKLTKFYKKHKELNREDLLEDLEQILKREET